MGRKDNKTTNDIKTERSFIEIIQDIDYRLTHLEDMEMDNRKLIAKLVKQGNTIVEFLKEFEDELKQHKDDITPGQVGES